MATGIPSPAAYSSRGRSVSCRQSKPDRWVRSTAARGRAGPLARLPGRGVDGPPAVVATVSRAPPMATVTDWRAPPNTARPEGVSSFPRSGIGFAPTSVHPDNVRVTAHPPGTSICGAAPPAITAWVTGWYCTPAAGTTHSCASPSTSVSESAPVMAKIDEIVRTTVTQATAKAGQGASWMRRQGRASSSS